MRNQKSETVPRIWIGNILLFCSVVAIGLFAGELTVRLMFGNMVVLPRYHTDADYGEFTLRRLRPNTRFWHTTADGTWKFITNTQGFRSTQDYAYDKPNDTLRILALGDSQTEGFEVRQDRTYSEVLKRFLNTHGIKAQVFNTGISGYSTSEELAFLENEGIRYKPDFVVLGFYSNDFEDNIKAGIFELRDGKLFVAKKTHIPGVQILNLVNGLAPLRWLSENSYLYSYVMNTIWYKAKKLLLTKSEEKLETEFAIPTEQVTAYNKELVVHLIKRMNEFCQKYGVPLIILDIPSVGDENEVFNSSVPADLVPVFVNNSFAFISSEKLLAKYRHLAEIHRPHGHHHITGFTHLVFGMELGRVIEEAYRNRNRGSGTNLNGSNR